MQIAATAPPETVLALNASEGAGQPGLPSFADTLSHALDSVNTLQWQSQNQSQALAGGRAANVHDVTIALEQANIALQLTATVRNKVVEAYQEIMRMQV